MLRRDDTGVLTQSVRQWWSRTTEVANGVANGSRERESLMGVANVSRESESRNEVANGSREMGHQN